MRGRFASRLSRRAQWWATPVAAIVVLGACTAAPVANPAPPSGSGTVTSSGAPGGVTGMPVSELSVAGITIAQSMGDDPALPVSVRRPVVPGQDQLTADIASWAGSVETAFRKEAVPSSDAPPELNVGWQVVTASGPVLGIRMETFEFGGASGRTAHKVFYGDGTTTWTGLDLVEPSGREQLAGLIRAAVKSLGHPTIGPNPTDPDDPTAARAEDLMSDVSLTAAGELVVLLDQGTAAPYSSGNLKVTLPSATVTPVLSERGRRVAQAVASGLPYAVSVPTSAVPTSAAPTSAGPAPTSAPAGNAQSPGPAVDCASVKCVALTFDDGPGPLTGRLLDSLVAEGVTATFFVLGQNVRVHPDLVARMVRSGMVVANHTWDHRDMKRLSLDDARSEVDRTSAEITKATGLTSTLLRPPYGSYNAQVTTLGQAIILWDVDTEDWKNRSASVTTTRALATARAGSIILMHDIHASTIEAVPGIVRALKSRGFTLVTVPQLLGQTQAGKVYTRR